MSDKKSKRGNEQLARLVKKAAGNRSLSKYAKDAEVNPSIVTRIATEDYKPGIKVLERLSSEKAAPQGGVTLSDYMRAAGYSTKVTSSAITDLTAGMVSFATICAFVAGELQRKMMLPGIGSALNEVSSLASSNNETKTGKLKKEQKAKIDEESFERVLKMIKGVIYEYIEKRGFAYMVDREHGGVDFAVKPDFSVKIVNNETCNEWCFFCMPAGDFKKSNKLTRKQEAEIFIMQLALSKCNSARKISVVVEDEEGFDAFKGFNNSNSFKGNLSVIKVDLSKMIVEEESEISTY